MKIMEIVCKNHFSLAKTSFSGRPVLAATHIYDIHRYMIHLHYIPTFLSFCLNKLKLYIFKMSVLVETTLGDLVIDLFTKERPNACKNFLKLCKIKYYNLCQFFTIEPNYIAQTGDPTNNGRGGESIHGILFGDQARYFEMEQVPKMRHTRRGLVSMVNNGNGLIGSQFFITLADELDYLDGKHCIFGQVSEGLETVGKLNEELVNEDNRPYRDVRIAHTIILDDPFDDPPRLKMPRRSPSPTLEIIKLENQMALDERVDEDEGKTAKELKVEMEAKEMRAQAQILEMVGDLHYADEKPPDDVLFVCKLNPVTTDEDLEVIFSRFGNITSCEVIRDRRTGASLQYAFVEFEKPEQCEQAFLKMDNVLIDDRRIHVDFSQSVAKNYKWERKEASKNQQSSPLSKPASNPTVSSPSRRHSSNNQREGIDRRRVDVTRERIYSEKRRRSRSRNRETNRRRERENQRHHGGRRDADYGRPDDRKWDRDEQQRHHRR